MKKIKLKKYAIITIIIVAIGYGIYILAQSASPKGKDFSRPIPIIGESHIAIDINYPSIIPIRRHRGRTTAKLPSLVFAKKQFPTRTSFTTLSMAISGLRIIRASPMK